MDNWYGFLGNIVLLLLFAKGSTKGSVTWMAACHCCSVCGYWVKRWKKMDVRGRSHHLPPRWHRWICAGQTAAPPGLSGCNSSSTVASGPRLPEQSYKKTWSDAETFCSPTSLSLYLDGSPHDDTSEPLNSLMNPRHGRVGSLRRSPIEKDTIHTNDSTSLLY